MLPDLQGAQEAARQLATSPAELHHGCGRIGCDHKAKSLRLAQRSPWLDQADPRALRKRQLELHAAGQHLELAEQPADVIRQVAPLMLRQQVTQRLEVSCPVGGPELREDVAVVGAQVALGAALSISSGQRDDHRVRAADGVITAVEYGAARQRQANNQQGRRAPVHVQPKL
ncbi:MAG: hypothetical protein ACYTGO_21045 [Planctomycetota bacterium]